MEIISSSTQSLNYYCNFPALGVIHKEFSSFLSFSFFFFFFFFLVFLGPHLQHMEVPMLGVKLELLLLAIPQLMAPLDP